MHVDVVFFHLMCYGHRFQFGGSIFIFLYLFLDFQNCVATLIHCYALYLDVIPHPSLMSSKLEPLEVIRLCELRADWLLGGRAQSDWKSPVTVGMAWMGFSHDFLTSSCPPCHEQLFLFSAYLPCWPALEQLDHGLNSLPTVNQHKHLFL